MQGHDSNEGLHSLTIERLTTEQAERVQAFVGAMTADITIRIEPPLPEVADTQLAFFTTDGRELRTDRTILHQDVEGATIPMVTKDTICASATAKKDARTLSGVYGIIKRHMEREGNDPYTYGVYTQEEPNYPRRIIGFDARSFHEVVQSLGTGEGIPGTIRNVGPAAQALLQEFCDFITEQPTEQ